MAAWDALINTATRLDQYPAQNAIAALKDQVNSYVKSAGTNEAVVTQIKQSMSELDNVITGYDNLIVNMKKEIERLGNDSNITAKLATISTLRENIRTLTEEKKALEVDMHTAEARREAVDAARKHVSYSQLFGGISRPIKPISVPILITLIVGFMIVGFFAIYKLWIHGAAATTATAYGISATAPTTSLLNALKLR